MRPLDAGKAPTTMANAYDRAASLRGGGGAVSLDTLRQAMGVSREPSDGPPSRYSLRDLHPPAGYKCSIELRPMKQ